MPGRENGENNAKLCAGRGDSHRRSLFMTIVQFQATKWTFGMLAEYHADGKLYRISTVDFGESLVGLLGVVQNEPDETIFVRCENVTLR